jgi:methylglutamate dehydrogenase subunit D
VSNAMPDWQPASAFDGIVPFSHATGGRKGVPPGVTIRPIAHADMVTIICAAGQREAFADFARREFGLDVPGAGRAGFGDRAALIWSAPDQWLALPVAADADALVTALAGIAAVTEQGDGRALLELSGPAVRATLAKGLAIDLDPTVFSEGSAAATALSHISVQVWQTSADPTYMLAVPRSMIGHIWDWLLESAAEYGYVIERREALYPQAA